MTLFPPTNWLTSSLIHGMLYINVGEGILKKEYELWKSVRDFWKTGKTGFVLFLVSLFGSIYSCIALNYEITRGWNGYVSVQNVVKDISAFIPVDVFLVGMIVGGIDFIMLLSDWYLARQEKRIQAAVEEAEAEAKAEGFEQGKAEGKAEGIAEGKAEGIAEGKAEGIAEAYRLIAEWDARRKAAEARGEPFTESPPGTSQNGSEK